MKHCVILITSLLLAPLAALHAADFHVAPRGSDANPGTEAQPFATLQRARDAVRATRAARSAGPGSHSGGWRHVSDRTDRGL